MRAVAKYTISNGRELSTGEQIPVNIKEGSVFNITGEKIIHWMGCFFDCFEFLEIGGWWEKEGFDIIKEEEIGVLELETVNKN